MYILKTQTQTTQFQVSFSIVVCECSLVAFVVVGSLARMIEIVLKHILEKS